MTKELLQLNILMNNIRDIVKNKNCPDWVFKKLTLAVKAAKELNNTENNTANNIKNVDTKAGYEIDYYYREYEINEYVVSNIENDECLYQIIDKSDPINNINLFTLKIIHGDKKNPSGYVIHNVPETMLQHIKYER